MITEPSTFAIKELPSVETASFASDVRVGLGQSPKSLPAMYLYDTLGSVLFEAICELPEYSVTRDEAAILTAHAHEIVDRVGPITRLVELGSGSATKTVHVIRAILDRQQELEYVPIDVSRSALEQSASILQERFPRLTIQALQGSYDYALSELSGRGSDEPCLVLFLGSSIGNLEVPEARQLLRATADMAGSGGSILLGTDLVRPIESLVSAYDDALGVTAAFNLNVLKRINVELGGTFDISRFRHRARFVEASKRVELHLESLVEQEVHIGALEINVHFAAGETIWTESSHKYDDAVLTDLLSGTGLMREQYWEDSDARFRSSLLRSS